MLGANATTFPLFLSFFSPSSPSFLFSSLPGLSDLQPAVLRAYFVDNIYTLYEGDLEACHRRRAHRHKKISRRITNGKEI